MTYPLFAGSPSEASEPAVIGGDIEFLLDTPVGWATANVGEIREIVEADLYDDVPNTLDDSRIYMLSRNAIPRPVSVHCKLVQTNIKTESGSVYHQMILQIVDFDGGVVAQAPYRQYLEAPSA